MEISTRFIDILKSIEYHVGHLPRDLFANEEQLPELLPIFTWFIDNVSPKSNCVTPKELELYASVSCKHDNFNSLEKVSKEIEKFYDETTLKKKVCSSDLELLEKSILKSQQELDDLKAIGTLYENKSHLMNHEISLLEEKDKYTGVNCYKIENNQRFISKSFLDEVDELGFNIMQLHKNVTNSMTNDNECLAMLASKTVINLTESWRQQIMKMINMWFKEENISSVKNDSLPSYIHTLSLLFESVTALRMAERNVQCDILKLNIAVNNVFNIKNIFNEDKDSLHTTGIDITNYLNKCVKYQEISIDSYQESSSNEYDNLRSCISDIVVADAEKKLFKLKTVDDRITFVLDSVEHYNIVCDVLYCLMRMCCSMANLKCELVLHSINIIETISYDIINVQNWMSNHADVNAQLSKVNKIENKTSRKNEVKSVGYKHYLKILANKAETEKLYNRVLQWKSKYHYSRNECNKLATLQKKLHVCNNSINELDVVYSNEM